MNAHLSVLMLVTLLALGSSFVFAALTFNVTDYGAKGDATTDDTAALQAALDAAGAAGGGIVQLPQGKFLVKGSLTVPRGVTLQGLWQAPHHAALDFGSVIYATGGKGDPDAKPLINLSPDACVKGLTFFYPEQDLKNIQSYPWTIQGQGMHGSVIDVTLVNSYQGIDFGTHHNELHYIDNVFGCPLKIGVYLDKCTDIGRVQNVHFNPHYWLRANDPQLKHLEGGGWPLLREYLFNNLTAFLLGRSDWEYMFNTFSFGAHIGYHFTNRGSGGTNGNFLGIAADWAWTGVLIDATQPFGLLITNGEFVGGAGSRYVIDLSDGVAQFSNCSFWGPLDTVLCMRGKRSYCSLSQCNICQWDHSKSGVAAIEAKGGTLIVQGSRFDEHKLAFSLGPELYSASIVGNAFKGGLQMENQCKGQVEVGLNVPLP